MTDPDPTRVVADTDVLVADLFIGQDARTALDIVRSHAWMELIATEELLDEAGAVIAELATADLAEDWRRRVDKEAVTVEPTGPGHPALVAASAGKAATVLSLDERLRSAETGAAIRPALATSVKAPDAFVRLVDPASLYETVVGDAYPGADRDPRG